MVALGLILLLIGTAGFSFFISRFIEDPMDDVARSAAPGQLAELSNGFTHYQLQGPPKGPIVVLIHGLRRPSYVFDALVPVLTGMGYRTLRYDLYGRGFSDRPQNPQTADFFVEQLQELLNRLGINSPLTVVGYGMGATIAAKYSEIEHESVKRLMLICPTMYGVQLGKFIPWCARNKWIGDWAMQTMGTYVLKRELEQRPPPVEIPDLYDRSADEFSTRGYLKAVLSSHRNCNTEDITQCLTKLAQTKTGVLAIWGARDTNVPSDAKNQLLKALPQVKQLVLPDGGHGLPHTHARTIARTLAPPKKTIRKPPKSEMH